MSKLDTSLHLSQAIEESFQSNHPDSILNITRTVNFDENTVNMVFTDSNDKFQGSIRVKRINEGSKSSFEITMKDDQAEVKLKKLLLVDKTHPVKVQSQLVAKWGDSLFFPSPSSDETAEN